MKKTIALLVAAACLCALLAACGAKPATEMGTTAGPATEAAPAADAAPEFKTVGEAVAYAGDGDYQASTYEKAYVYVFEKDGEYLRVIAELTPEQYEEFSSLDLLADDYAEKESAFLAELPVTKCESLNGQMLSEEETAALVGKTGEELLNGGWTTGSGYDLDAMDFYMEYSPFEYVVTFEKAGQLENSDDFDEEAAIRPLRVTAVKLFGIGNGATEMPEYSGEETIDYLVLVNKQNKLPDDWEETVVLEESTNRWGETYQVEAKALAAFLELQKDLLDNDGIVIELDSTYRSVKRQQEIWDEFEAEKGLEYAQKYVAVPGYSEHHTGLAIDICIEKDGVRIDDNDDMIAEKEIFSKIHAKLADHGFILRYLEGKDDVTGYAYEPWHFRYVDSPEIAHEITDAGLTLEEYLGADAEAAE